MILENNQCNIPIAEMLPLIQEAVCRGGQAEMTVTGHSMRPLLKNRVSSVRLEKPEQLRKGDIVLFRRHDGKCVLHRIVAVRGGCYDIAGDDQYTVDRDVPESSIIARVAAYNRAGRAWRKSDALYRILLPAIKLARTYGRRLKRKIKSRLT